MEQHDGIGSKSWLAYTDNFTYTCRKDGIERKYLIFKGEEFPESTLLYQKETTERNGVLVSVILNNNYYAVSECKEKIREQLAYLDNVYYDIEGFDNTYEIYRTEDFQISTLSENRDLHISLKNICYPIDFQKVGISYVNFPVALKFDNYDEIKPIFNRESIVYNQASIQAIKDKITKVADWFVDKWNENVSEFDNIIDGKDTILSSRHDLTLFEKGFDVNYISGFSSKQFKVPTVKGISVISPNLYASRLRNIMNVYDYEAFDTRGTWKKKYLYYEFESALRNFHSEWAAKVVVVDFSIVGHLKTFIRNKFNSSKQKYIYVKRNNNIKLFHHTFERSYYQMLSLQNLPKDKWRDAIKECQAVVESVQSLFIDARGLNTSKEYLDWLETYKADRKAGRVPSESNYVALGKEAGDITVYKARIAIKGNDMVFDKTKCKISELQKTFQKSLNVYVTEGAFPSYWVKLFPKVNFLKFNKTEVKHVLTIKNFIKKEQFMNTKPFARVATALFIGDLLGNEPSLTEIAISSFKDLENKREQLKEYYGKYQQHCSNTLKQMIINEAKDNMDMSIYPVALEFEAFIKKIGFLKVLKETGTWRTSPAEAAIIKNITYIMMKHQKLTGELVENFDLIPKPVVEAAPEEVKEETQGEILVDEEILFIED